MCSADSCRFLEVPQSDWETSGSPCTDFSHYGLRLQLKGHTYMYMLSWCALTETAAPKFVTWENVETATVAYILHNLPSYELLFEIVTEPVRLGWPINRRRRMATLGHRSVRVSIAARKSLFPTQCMMNTDSSLA